MACERSTDSDIHQTNLTDHKSMDKTQLQLFVEALFEQLPGTWDLDRRLQSTNVKEPAGQCVGTATFTRREPSVFINKDGKLELASVELVYHEQGYFEMQQASPQTNGLRFPFSRKYIWRYQQENKDQHPKFSIWFTKPGTETIDYLFHKVNVTMLEAGVDSTTVLPVQLQAEGCHLCEDDLYSSSYSFSYMAQSLTSELVIDQMKVKSWNMVHEVRGPNKDQIIETTFSWP